MFVNFFKSKLFKFFVGGGISAFINLITIFLLIEYIGFNTLFLRNIANIIAIELSLLASFFIYRNLVWNEPKTDVREIFFSQLFLYHISAGIAVVTRVFLIFPILDCLHFSYSFNTLVGIILSASINYMINDRIVFRSYASEKRTNQEINRQHSPVHFFSIVIPAHNEEEIIQNTLVSIINTLEEENINYEVLVINDNSQDRTEEILKQISYRHSKVRYINNYYPNGFGFAVRCGLENFQGDAVTIVMADCSDSTQNIVDYYHKLEEGYDCVFGSRFIEGGKVIDYPVYKLVVNRLANLFIKLLFGIKYNDTTNAFKAYRRDVIDGISPLVCHHFNLTVEIPLKALTNGYSYSTIPITWRNRKLGTSKLKLREMGSRYFSTVFSIWLKKHFTTRNKAKCFKGLTRK